MKKLACFIAAVAMVLAILFAAVADVNHGHGPGHHGEEHGESHGDEHGESHGDEHGESHGDEHGESHDEHGESHDESPDEHDTEHH